MRVTHPAAVLFFAGTVALLTLASPGAPRTVSAQSGAVLQSGVYSAAQSKRGQALYDAQCATCHGPTLTGDLAPPLTGTPFFSIWAGQSAADLADKIQHTMPASKPGSVTRQQAVDLVAFIISAGGFPAGSAELKGDDGLQKIALAAPGAATATAATPSAPSGRGPAADALAKMMAARPLGNLAQMMRGILFPSSNLIFNVQNNDPGEQKVGWQPGATAFSWADWGAGIYPGWDLVDYAAVAIAESGPMLLMPGRRCENGKPVPVDDARWIKFSEELIEAGRAAYKASQSRDREAVSESTNQLADSCLNCHEAFRDKPGRTDADPSNKAARCVP